MSTTLLSQTTLSRVNVTSPLPSAPELPEPLSRYLGYSRVNGRRPIRSAHVRFRGWFRTDPNAKWRPLKSELELYASPPKRTWTGTMKLLPFLSVRARDMYGHGVGRMRVDVLSLVRITDAEGPEMDVSGLLTVLAELPLMPTALLPSPHLTWQRIDNWRALATLRHEDLAVSGVFRFDERGRIVRFETNERYAYMAGKFTRTPWQVAYNEYIDFGRVRVPMCVQASWTLNGAEYRYADFIVENIEFS